MEPHEIAKEFFDDLYGKRFKDWRSIRCAMLSRKKYGAIMNGFSNNSSIEDEFIQHGAVNIVQQLRHNAAEMLHNTKQDMENLACVVKDLGSPTQYSSNEDSEIKEGDQSVPSQNYEIQQTSTSESQELVLAELEGLERRCKIYSDLTQVCQGLHMYMYPRGVLTEFEDPIGLRSSKHVLDYFLLDGSSVLPVLALDPKPRDHVLDICAAPGGKWMCILQLFRESEGTTLPDFSTSLAYAH